MWQSLQGNVGLKNTDRTAPVAPFGVSRISLPPELRFWDNLKCVWDLKVFNRLFQKSFSSYTIFTATVTRLRDYEELKNVSCGAPVAPFGLIRVYRPPKISSLQLKIIMIKNNHDVLKDPKDSYVNDAVEPLGICTRCDSFYGVMWMWDSKMSPVQPL